MRSAPAVCAPPECVNVPADAPEPISAIVALSDPEEIPEVEFFTVKRFVVTDPPPVTVTPFCSVTPASPPTTVTGSFNVPTPLMLSVAGIVNGVPVTWTMPAVEKAPKYVDGLEPAGRIRRELSAPVTLACGRLIVLPALKSTTLL